MEDCGQEIARKVGSVAKMICVATGMKIGFAVLLFEFADGPGGWSTYVSNAQREDMIKALREQADALEKRLHNPPLRDRD